MTTARNWLRQRFPSVFGKSAPPVIMTEWGPVTEMARQQCAINMKVDTGVKARVEKLLVDKLGQEQGMAEARRRYPECYQDEK